MTRDRPGVSLHGIGISFALLLSLVSNEAMAAALGSLTTSFGLMATFAALLTLDGWSGQAPAGLVSATAAMLVVGAAVVWLLRSSRRSDARFRAGGASPGGLRHCGAMVTNSREVTLPVGFDRTELLSMARQHFVTLQSAWDARDLTALRALITPDLLEDVSSHMPGNGMEPNHTEVLILDATLLGFDDLDSAFLASVEFSGMIRECGDQGAVAFREVWMLTCPKVGDPAWRLARQQALL